MSAYKKVRGSGGVENDGKGYKTYLGKTSSGDPCHKIMTVVINSTLVTGRWISS